MTSISCSGSAASWSKNQVEDESQWRDIVTQAEQLKDDTQMNVNVANDCIKGAQKRALGKSKAAAKSKA